MDGGGSGVGRYERMVEPERRCLGEDERGGRIGEGEGGDAKQSASDAIRDAEQNAESWTDWAINKFTEKWGSDGENAREAAQEILDRARDAASKTTDKMNSVASETSEYTSNKVGEAAKVANAHLGHAKEYAAGKADEVVNMASDAKDTVADSVSHEWGRAEDVLHQAKQRAADAIPTDRDGMARQAKDYYEAAKEKASQAAGDLGAVMGGETAEL
ncbi:hypothetical protein Nepgr_026418 [Nepenthes gracilis]|uniref:Uncharacterized protein n=1 Tax=Nepenthes gracilis TaxID=150966 RepID=A0AAD3T6V7_NEPGR|nr:hypothetical protein Nepgr_026418 [Nepenthes gracilis]